MIERIKNIFQKIVPHYDHKGRVRVSRDWMIILAVLVITILWVIALNVRLFIRIDKGELFVIEDTDSITVSNTIDYGLLVETLEFFDKKEDRFEQLKRAAPPIPRVR